MYQRNIVARSPNHCCRGKAITITYSEHVCSRGYPERIAHAPYFVICGLPGWFTLSHKRSDFRKNLLNIKCVLILSTTFV